VSYVVINTKHTERETVVTLAEDGGWPRYQAWVSPVAQDPDFVRFQFQSQEREGATWFEAPFVPRQLWEALARFSLLIGAHTLDHSSPFKEEAVSGGQDPLEAFLMLAGHLLAFETCIGSYQVRGSFIRVNQGLWREEDYLAAVQRMTETDAGGLEEAEWRLRLLANQMGIDQDIVSGLVLEFRVRIRVRM
jgi:hypothetical protein